LGKAIKRPSLERFSISRSYAKNEKRPDVCVFCNLPKAGKLQNALGGEAGFQGEDEIAARVINLLAAPEGADSLAAL
jgi:hypothetical protein